MGQLTISGQIVLFDDIDSAVIEGGQWHLHPAGKATYARGYVKGRRSDGLRYMHRCLTGAAKGKDVDHINGNGLDNRRENLRVCDRSQNSANRHAVMSAHGIKGVHFENYTGRWRAEIQWRRKRYKLGRFDTAEEAAAAYAAKAHELFKEFANPVHTSSK